MQLQRLFDGHGYDYQHPLSDGMLLIYGTDNGMQRD